MRTFLAAVALSGAMIGATSADETTAAELMALEGEVLLAAAGKLAFSSDEKFSGEELVALTAKVAVATRQRQLLKQPPRGFAFEHFFENACGKANGAQLATLTDIYCAIDPAEFAKQELLPELATALVINDLATRGDLRAVELPPFEGSVPSALADAPQELVAAWVLYKRATQRFDSVFQRVEKQQQTVSFQENPRSFYGIIDDVLQGRAEGRAEQLFAYVWSGWCGTGSDALAHPQMIGTFLALLRENRIPEAIGAAIRLDSGAPLVSRGGRENARIEFLKQCGLDWEAILAGAQMAHELGSASGAWQDPALQELAACGSDRGATFLAQMARRATRERQGDYATAIATMIRGDTNNIETTWHYTGQLDRSPDIELSAETTAQLVAALQELATPQTPSPVVEAALVGFARAKSADTKPTLRALLKHQSPDVTKTAAQILRSLGETVAPPAPAQPVRFRLSLNGAPVPAGAAVRWQIKFGSGGSTSSSKTADDNGIVALQREDFLDREQLATEVVFSGVRREDGVDGVDEPYFFVTLPVPAELNAVTAVDVSLTPVELRVDRFHAVADARDGTAKVQIQRQEPRRDPTGPYEYFDRAPWNFEVPLGQAVPLSIQSGSYDLEIVCAGAEKHKSTFTVGAQPMPLRVRVNPGGDLRVKIVRPEGELGAHAVILQNGKEMEDDHFDWETKTHRGLPTGQYLLRIYSSAEAYPAGEGRGTGAPLVPYAGRDIPFTITGISAEAVDLGEVRLEAAAN